MAAVSTEVYRVARSDARPLRPRAKPNASSGGKMQRIRSLPPFRKKPILPPAAHAAADFSRSWENALGQAHRKGSA